MKPFAAIDITHNKKNETVNGAEFCVARPSEALQQAFEAASQKVDDTLAKTQLPLPLRILKHIFLYLGLIVFIGLIKGLSGDITLEQYLENAGWLILLCGGCLLGYVVLLILGNRKEKSVMDQEDSEMLLSRFNGISESIFSELSVPANARATDILSFFYKKDCKVKPVVKATTAFDYMNLEYRLYSDEENLYLVNLDGKFAFPKASLKAIRTKKQNILLASWNKDVPYDEGFYKQFKLVQNQYGSIVVKKYHILELERDGETWGIWFPSYELPAFEILTGLKAE